MDYKNLLPLMILKGILVLMVIGEVDNVIVVFRSFAQPAVR